MSDNQICMHGPRCGCGVLSDTSTQDTLTGSVVEEAALRAIIPDQLTRRQFIAAVGASTAIAAISSFFPIEEAKAVITDSLNKVPEKSKLNVGFLPITCATPIIVAQETGLYAKQGLDVSLLKTAGWAVVRDKTLAGEFDASHMLSPMPLAISIGAGSTAVPMVMPVLENTNGNAITLHNKHRNNRDPKNWKGMQFGVPFEFSMHNFLLRYYLAYHGIDPDKDVQLRVMPPPDMVANLRAENIDGFIVAEPFNQRAVYDGIGFIHVLTSELWMGHPCCAFATTEQFARDNPNTFASLVRALIEATYFANKSENRQQVAEMISTPNYLAQPVTVLEQILTGRFADGLGAIRNDPDRISFDPFPWQSMAVWMLSQMKRWGYLNADIDYHQVAEQVFLATDARKRMAELGFAGPSENYRTHTIMGKEFDSADPSAYLESLRINSAS